MIRLGQPFIDGAVEAAVLLRQLTDITERGRDFYQQVFIVEIHPDDVYVHPYRQWGEKEKNGKQETFVPDLSLAVAAPVLVATGGNPKSAQGRYGVPAYYFYYHSQIDTTDRAKQFLASRIEKTYDGHFYVEKTELIARKLAAEVSAAPESRGLVILCDLTNARGAFMCGDPAVLDNMVCIGTCFNGKGRLWADLAWILNKLWWAKLEEGAQYGRSSQATCSFCHDVGEVVSLYSKAWPWYSVTWTGPLSGEVNKHSLHEEVAVCQHCYAALSYGGKLFSSLSRPMPPQIFQEAFKGNVQSRNKLTAPSVRGTAFVLPALDGFMADDQDFYESFVMGLGKMRYGNGTGADRHLGQVVGFDAWFPEEFAYDIYRLTLIYYTQENADVQLWAVIEDVSPAAVAMLYDEIQYLSQYAKQLGISYDIRIPTLLARAYGAGYLWQSLTQVMRLEAPGRFRFIRRVSRDLQNTAKTAVRGGGLWTLQDVAKFYLIFSRFLYVLKAAGSEVGEGGGLVRTWQELQALANGDPDQMVFEDNVEELGYVIGHLVKRFSQQYYSKTQKEYLSSRVMTFGTDLTPDLAGFRALGKIEEVSLKLSIPLNQQFRQQIAATLAEFLRQIDGIRKERDAFMAAFWAGYGLYDLGRSNKVASLPR